jgi:hypothetical protein
MRTKIKEDRHGLYFRTGGHLFRATPTRFSPGGIPRRLEPQPNTFAVGEEVNVRHISQSTLGSIKSLDGTREELWHSHGSYLNGSGRALNSEDIFGYDNQTSLQNNQPSSEFLASNRMRVIREGLEVSQN